MASGKRYLVLAEGKSGDPHYGKTMRGVVRYGADPVVVVLDSERAGESYEGLPIVGTVEEALAYEPTTAIVGVATAGGRFPPAWKELLRECVEAGPRPRERAARVPDERPGAGRARGGARGRAARPAQAARRTERPDRREPGGAGDDRAHGRLRLRDREDDHGARARPRGAAARDQIGLRSHRADRDRDRRAGGSRSTRSSPTSSPARPNGSSSRGARAGESCSGSRARGRSRIPRTRE